MKAYEEVVFELILMDVDDVVLTSGEDPNQEPTTPESPVINPNP